jgi:ubiquinone/menaquinone biosynthesis C-methylase UbiE
MDPLTEAARVEREKYNRTARLYNIMEFPMEFLWYRRWRRRLFELVEGPRLLEVGVGTGKNLPSYPADIWAVAVDLSEKMMAKARPLALEKGVRLVQMDAQRLALRDASFDTVLATFVFCSVPDPIAGLSEIRRVLKPGGRALFLEHVLPESRPLAGLFNALDPVVAAASGVHINRRTAENLQRAGLHLVKEENLLSTIFKLFVAERADTIETRPVEATEDQLPENRSLESEIRT